MGRRFRRESSYRDVIADNPERMKALGEQLIAQNGLIVSERDGQVTGMLGFVLFDHFISGERTCGEVFWWLNPESRGEGLKLLREVERRAKLAGAKHIQMIAPTAEVARVYERLKYRFVESTYQRDL